jgi:hypothetical protein
MSTSIKEEQMSDKLKLLLIEYKTKSISALETMTIEELEYLISEAKKRYDYTTSVYAPILTDIEYDLLVNFTYPLTYTHTIVSKQ